MVLTPFPPDTQRKSSVVFGFDAMPDLELPRPTEWGHRSPPIAPEDIIEELTKQTARAVSDYSALPYADPCKAKTGFCRVYVEISLGPTFFDELMNGATGYRAHYSV